VKHGYKRDTGSILPETGPQNGMILGSMPGWANSTQVGQIVACLSRSLVFDKSRVVTGTFIIFSLHIAIQML